MEIRLEEEEKESTLPMYAVGLFIAISGVSFFILTLYYIAFLPVPSPMNPLKVRILTTMRLRGLEQGEKFALLEANQKKEAINVYSQSDINSDVKFTLDKGELVKVIDKGEELTYIEHIDKGKGWVKTTLLINY